MKHRWDGYYSPNTSPGSLDQFWSATSSSGCYTIQRAEIKFVWKRTMRMRRMAETQVIKGKFMTSWEVYREEAVTHGSHCSHLQTFDELSRQWEIRRILCNPQRQNLYQQLEVTGRAVLAGHIKNNLKSVLWLEMPEIISNGLTVDYSDSF